MWRGAANDLERADEIGGTNRGCDGSGDQLRPAGGRSGTLGGDDACIRRVSAACRSAYAEGLPARRGRKNGSSDTMGTMGGGFIWKRPHPPTGGEDGKEKDGEVFVACVAGCDSNGVAVSGGLIHDWLGVVFIPGVSLRETLALVQDYDHARDYYAPNVAKSRVLSHADDRWKVFLQLKQTDVVTVVFNTE